MSTIGVSALGTLGTGAGLLGGRERFRMICKSFAGPPSNYPGSLTRAQTCREIRAKPRARECFRPMALLPCVCQI